LKILNVFAIIFDEGGKITMKKILTLSVLMIVVAVLLTGCTNPFSKNDNSTENNTVTNTTTNSPALLDGYTTYDGKKYSIQYSNDWTAQEDTTSSYPTDVFLSASGLSRVSVTLENLPIVYTLDQYTNASITNLQNNYTVSEVNKDKVTVNGYDAYRISYNMTVSGKTTAIMQTILVNNKTGYVLTYSGSDADGETVYHNMENSLVMK